VQLLASNSSHGQRVLTGGNDAIGHYYGQLMTAANASCRWSAAGRFTDQSIITP